MPVSGSALSVSRLVALLKEVVEENFVQVLVEGEISNFATPASGHHYFTLKDQGAQLRAVMFRTQNRLLPYRPENGMQVVCSGRVSVYSQRGEIQLVVETMEPLGAGSLQVAFEQLKARLSAEGLFAAERKRPLPAFPRTIGVVTSATGAAIHDILNVLKRRAAGVRVLLFPVRVQGEGAAAEIAGAIAALNRQGQADVLIVGRGGGSLEDLWAFNEEPVARAIHASRIPVISAVGHEVDFTIADFVADLRAPTPSAAAELVVKSRLELEGHLDHLVMRLAGQMQGRLGLLRERVDGLARRLRSPRQELARMDQRWLELERRLRQAMAGGLRERGLRLGAAAARLDALSPLRTLNRGYAIVFDEKTGAAVRDSASLVPGGRLRIRLARGQLRARVEEIEP
ncbi:exodeoxyribonuclease 7 large subunit [Desulfuromonas versatilis]|uniref:Exodeoxyribonuclease 7 large subunit n=1 Tax=Desulfuromonas versatilis TaxID=2802975 RepID=A0ABN6E0A8_9BACT|nr:exodeoxyribonuclease VII large subunit [Desulfuromonas versatilis]BCR05755.1 exodeoxyribonuclease 7 large subunit [Desulfuromonas versatilis]